MICDFLVPTSSHSKFPFALGCGADEDQNDGSKKSIQIYVIQN